MPAEALASSTTLDPETSPPAGNRTWVPGVWAPVTPTGNVLTAHARASAAMKMKTFGDRMTHLHWLPDQNGVNKNKEITRPYQVWRSGHVRRIVGTQ